MQALLKTLAVAVAAFLVFSAFDDASAGSKKPRPKRTEAPLVQRDAQGVPIIMRGYRSPPPVSIMTDEPGTGRVSDPPSKKAERRRGRPRGSSTYIPPPVPSPSASAVPAPALLQRGPGVYNPPPIRSYGDRVRDCIHSYPLNRGIGNNPTDQQSYIRQCAN
jgi:hypothetical protein